MLYCALSNDHLVVGVNIFINISRLNSMYTYNYDLKLYAGADLLDFLDLLNTERVLVVM